MSEKLTSARTALDQIVRAYVRQQTEAFAKERFEIHRRRRREPHPLKVIGDGFSAVGGAEDARMIRETADMLQARVDAGHVLLDDFEVRQIADEAKVGVAGDAVLSLAQRSLSQTVVDVLRVKADAVAAGWMTLAGELEPKSLDPDDASFFLLKDATAPVAEREDKASSVNDHGLKDELSDNQTAGPTVRDTPVLDSGTTAPSPPATAGAYVDAVEDAPPPVATLFSLVSIECLGSKLKRKTWAPSRGPEIKATTRRWIEVNGDHDIETYTASNAQRFVDVRLDALGDRWTRKNPEAVRADPKAAEGAIVQNGFSKTVNKDLSNLRGVFRFAARTDHKSNWEKYARVFDGAA